MKPPINVAILEDIREVAESLQEVLNEAEGIECLRLYHNAEDAIHFLSPNPVDILIVDIGLPRASGIEAILQLSQNCKKMQYCMFTIYEDDEKIFDSLKAGAKGYILKRSGPEKVILAIKELFAGGSPMSPSIARRILDVFQNTKIQPKPVILPLSEREMELLDHLSQGLLYKEAATIMGITTGTVKQHIHKIYGKLHVSNKTEALNKYRGQ